MTAQRARQLLAEGLLLVATLGCGESVGPGNEIDELYINLVTSETEAGRALMIAGESWMVVVDIRFIPFFKI